MSALPLAFEIEAAMAQVDDPCSLMANAPLSVVELGLVREWSLDDGRVSITIAPTAPSCTLIASIKSGLIERVGRVAGVTEVKVVLDSDFVWSPDEISPAGQAKLGARHDASMSEVPVKPRQWQRTS